MGIDRYGMLVGIAQLVRASDCGSEGHGFKSHCPPHLPIVLLFIVLTFYVLKALDYARMAELVDAPDLGSGTFGCVGSSPIPRTNRHF